LIARALTFPIIAFGCRFLTFTVATTKFTALAEWVAQLTLAVREVLGWSILDLLADLTFAYSVHDEVWVLACLTRDSNWRLVALVALFWAWLPDSLSGSLVL
jgi:hypothetical protein